MADNSRRRSRKQTFENPVDKPASVKDVPVTISLRQNNGSFVNVDVSLHSHCLLCLRRVVPRQEETSPTKKIRVEDEEETVEAAEFVFGELPSLLRTLEWARWTLVENVRDVREAAGTGEGNGVRFGMMPTLCEACGQSLCLLNNLLHSVREEVQKLKDITTEGQRRSGDFKRRLTRWGLDKGKIDRTVQFLEELWNPAAPEVECKEEEEEISSESDENPVVPSPVPDRPPPSAPDDDNSCGDSLRNFRANEELPESEEEYEWIDPLDDDYVKSELEEDEEEFNDLSDLSQDSIPNQPRDPKGGPRKRYSKEKGKEDVKCEVCGLWVKHNYLRRHCVGQHNGVGAPPAPPRVPPKEPKFPCRVCGVQLCRSYYRPHMKSKHNLNEGPLPPHVNIAPNACDLCKARMTRAELVEHVKTHVGEDYVLHCVNPECSYACATLLAMRYHIYDKPSQINRHLSNFSAEVDQFEKSWTSCSQCNFEASGHWPQTLLKQHLLEFHETATDKRYPCPITGCGQSFTVKQSVTFHLMVHHRERQPQKQQPCPLCPDRKKVAVENMSPHLRGKHGAKEILKCAHCAFQFSTRGHLLDHLLVHRHTIEYYSCELCGDKAGNFAKHHDLLVHYFQEHKIGKQFVCEYCDKTFMRQYNLQIHVGNLHKDKPQQQRSETFQCEECGLVLKSKTALRSHCIRDHGAVPYRCTSCPATFTKQKALSEHIKYEHKGVKPKEKKEWRCEETDCGATFTTKKVLDMHHSKVHLGETGKHVCEECGKAYFRSFLLKRHQEIAHLGIKRHECDECGEKFSCTSTLKKHRLIHTGERPYACEQCGQKFRHKEVLKTHLKGHEEKGDSFRPNGPMKHIRKRVKR